CLNLGYEGRYRAMHNGRVQLEAVIKELHDVIRTERGPTEPLSLFKSEGIVQKAHRVAWQTPISLVVIAAFATAVLLYLTFFLLTRSEATRSLEQLNQIIGR
ncbi:DotU family type IV/VI secretion system protein, partial [Streptomyces sp. NPDC050698]